MTISISLAAWCQKVCSSHPLDAAAKPKKEKGLANLLFSHYFDLHDKLKDDCCISYSKSTCRLETHSEVLASHVHLEVMSKVGQTPQLVQPWSLCELKPVRTLQDAPRNHGCVDLMQSLKDGSFVAVKRMPNWWMAVSDDEFQKQHANSMERPWLHIGIVEYLQSQDFPYVCKSHGVFRDAEFTYVVSDFAEEGSLFKWCYHGPHPGYERETVLRPIVRQVLTAVQMLHSLGIAHRDLSLENIVSTIQGDSVQIKLIDFSMATWSRKCCNESCGKKSYQAPETLAACNPYNPFLADLFSLGVVLFTLGAKDYPWHSTRKDGCKFFKYVLEHGFRRYLGARKALNGKRLKDIFSKDFARLVEGLVHQHPEQRLTLGEQCWLPGMSRSRSSVWDMPWLQYEDAGALQQLFF